MRILLVTPWFPTERSPENGIFVLRDASALAGAHEVSVLHLDWRGDSPTLPTVDPRLSVQRLALAGSRLDTVRAFRAVRRAAREADVVHTHALTVLYPFVLGRPARGKPWVHTEHWSGLTSPDSLNAAGTRTRHRSMPLLRRPDSVIVACQRLTETIRSVRAGRIDVVPCVVEAPTDVHEAPREPGRIRLIAVGGLIERKGPLVAVQAVAELRKRDVDASLTWVGEGGQRAEVEAAIRTLGLEDVVTLTGILPEAGVRAALDAADVFVLPTRGDNFCIAVAEALTHGRPIVSGDQTGAVDYSEASVSRFLPLEADGAAYADAIEDLHAATARMSAVDIAATVRGKFSAERVRALLESIYADPGAPTGGRDE